MLMQCGCVSSAGDTGVVLYYSSGSDKAVGVEVPPAAARGAAVSCVTGLCQVRVVTEDPTHSQGFQEGTYGTCM